MLKRSLSVMLVLLMILTMLTGCSTTEFGYLQLQKEMAKIKQFQFMNTTKVSFGEEFMGERMDVVTHIVGEANVEDYKDMYLDTVININYNDYVGKEQVEVKLTDNKLYASTNAFKEANNIYIEQGVDDPVFDKYNKEIMGYDYWLVYDLDEDMKAADVEEVDLDVVYDEITTLMNKMFKGFDSKLVKATANGYKIEVTDESGKTAVNSLVKYVKDNRREIITVFEEGAKAITDEAQMKEVQTILDDIEQSLNELDTIVTPELVDMYAQTLKGSKLTLELSKQNDVYIQKVYLNLVANGSKFVTFETITDITKTDVVKVPIQGKILTEGILNEITGNLEDAEIAIRWANDSNETIVFGNKRNGESFEDVSTYVLIDNRVYLPLRFIGEYLGEEVGWDNNLRQAYVMKDGVKVDMTGVIVNDRTMVKIRDFEKLGYKVEYEQVDGISTAVIFK